MAGKSGGDGVWFDVFGQCHDHEQHFSADEFPAGRGGDFYHHERRLAEHECFGGAAAVFRGWRELVRGRAGLHAERDECEWRSLRAIGGDDPDLHAAFGDDHFQCAGGRGLRSLTNFMDTKVPSSNSEAAPGSVETVIVPPVDPKLAVAQERKAAIQAYHDATTREAKAAVVKQYPFLNTIYSGANHD